MVSLEQLGRMQTAQELITNRMRCSLVSRLTGVEGRTVRSWWHQIHGEAPPSGKTPATALRFIKNQRDATRAAAFVSFYRATTQSADVDLGDFLDVFKLFTRLHGVIDANAAFYALQDIEEGIFAFPLCHTCKAHYLFDCCERVTSKCPFCGTDPSGHFVR